MNLNERLMDLARQNRLGHFYLVDGPGAEAFVHKFIKDYYQKIEGHKQSLDKLVDHPDVYVLGNLELTEDPESAAFTVEESEKLGRFLEFKAVQSKRKFAVITEAHRVNNLVANKWLKALEEPASESTIFLLNPKKQKMLDTIQSRAIHLRIPSENSLEHIEEWTSFLHDVQSMTLSQFLEKYIKGENDLSFWVEELIRHEARTLNSDYSSKNAFSQWLTQYREMDVFHQPSATKWSLFHSYLRENVLNRLNH